MGFIAFDLEPLGRSRFDSRRLTLLAGTQRRLDRGVFIIRNGGCSPILFRASDLIGGRVPERDGRDCGKGIFAIALQPNEALAATQ